MSSPKDLLVQALGDSVSQVDQERVRYATKQLEEWRTQPNFFSTLQEIFLDSNIPEGIRFQSIIYLKNNIDRYWRKTAKPGIGDDEKVRIRHGFLVALTMHLPRPWIATNAYAIGRIARHDFPRFWPDLITQLLTTVRTAFDIEQGGGEQWRMENSLKGLAAVIKELSSVRLGSAVSAFRQIAPEVFKILGSVYGNSTRHCIEQLPAESPLMAVSTKILGIMKNLLVYGLEKAGEQADSQLFFDIAVENLRDFYLLYNKLHGHSQEEVLQHIAKLMKLFAAFSSERPFEFLIMQKAPMLVTTFVQICQHNAGQFNKSSHAADDALLSVLGKIVINGISTIRSLLRVVSDPSILEKERTSRREQAAAASSTLQAIFDSSNILELAVMLLEHFLILRQSELEAWEEDPEEWVLEVAGEVVSAESGLRAAGEALFMELVSNYKEDMLRFIVHSIRRIQTTSMTPEHIIFREAVYNAISLNALALYDLIDFDEWLISVIPAELLYNGPHNNIIRRRMALLISDWVGTKCSESSRPKVYETLLNLLTPLDPRNDIVVRLSAALAFRYAIDEWNFKVDDFVPYLDAILTGAPQEQKTGGLIGLMQAVQHIEARVKLIQVIDVIVERMDRRIDPYVPVIMDLLPFLWIQSTEQPMFRAAALHSLKILTGALGERSITYEEFMVHLIDIGTDSTQQDEFIYLYEEALDLWEEAVKNAPTEVKNGEITKGSPYHIMGLFPRAITCLQFGSDTLKKVLRIIEYYIVLDPVGIMQQYANEIFTGFVGLGDLKTEANRMMMSVIELIIQGCPLNVFFLTFVQSGFLYKIITAVVIEDENLIITSQYLNILARIALQNAELLLHFVRTCDASPDFARRFVERWAGQKFDSIGQAKSRKLNAMGLTALLPTDDPDVLANLPSIMNVWFNVLSEVRDNDGGDALIYWHEEEDSDGTEFGGNYATSAHERRKRVFLQNDPVHNTKLKEFVNENLGRVETNVGGPEKFQEGYLRNVDDALVEQMRTMLL